MAKDVLHVVPHNEIWAVKREGNERPSSTHDTQRDAIENARNLAREGDDIVIHRPDGTIRERSTYMFTNDKSNGADKRSLKPSDVLSVGSRVSWSAVLAGAVVALTTYLTLTMLALAIGVTTVDYLQNKTFAISAAVIMTFSLLASLFLGGYIASLTTAGENTCEAAIYGVLVWGAMFGILLLIGSTLTLGFGSILGPIAPSQESATLSAEDMQTRLNLTEEQRLKYEQTVAEAKSLSEDVSPTTVAWIGFGSMVLSLLTAIAGSLSGAGPELAFRRIFAPASTTPVQSPA